MYPTSYRLQVTAAWRWGRLRTWHYNSKVAEGASVVKKKRWPRKINDLRPNHQNTQLSRIYILTYTISKAFKTEIEAFIGCILKAEEF